MKNVMIYQRPVNEELQLELNCSEPTPKSKAYFDLCKIGMGDTDAGLLVQAAIDYGFYKPTMFMTLSDQNQHAEGIYRKAGRSNAVALEEIFCEGNGHGRGDYETTSLQRHSSISVGDLVVDLEDGSVTVCMPHGWQLLNKTTLELKSQYNRITEPLTMQTVIKNNRKEAAEAVAEAQEAAYRSEAISWLAVAPDAAEVVEAMKAAEEAAQAAAEAEYKAYAEDERTIREAAEAAAEEEGNYCTAYNPETDI